MTDYLQKLVYLTEAQKATLFSTGTVTANGTTVTYNPNDLYITPLEGTYLPLTGGTLTGNLLISRSSGNSGVTVYQPSISSTKGLTLAFNTSGSQGLWSDGYGTSSAFTATGDWMIFRNTNGQTIVRGNVERRYSDVDGTTSNNSGMTYTPDIIWMGDKNSAGLGRIRHSVQSNGNISLYFQVRNYDMSSETSSEWGWGGYSGLIVTADKTGEVSYTITQPRNFLTALNIIYSDTAPVDPEEGTIWLKPV